VQDDPPRHSVLRRLVSKAFTARRIAQLEPWIRQNAEELIEAMGDGETEVMDGLAIPLPARVIARLMGIPGEDYLAFKHWSDTFLSMNTRDLESGGRARNAMEMAAYFGRVVAGRRVQGAEDLISALVEAELDGEGLPEVELLGFCVLLLIAGNETSTNLIGNMLNLLAARPELWRRVRQDRSHGRAHDRRGVALRKPRANPVPLRAAQHRNRRARNLSTHHSCARLRSGQPRPSGVCRSGAIQ
jgi:cytochrome P450